MIRVELVTFSTSELYLYARQCFDPFFFSQNMNGLKIWQNQNTGMWERPWLILIKFITIFKEKIFWEFLLLFSSETDPLVRYIGTWWQYAELILSVVCTTVKRVLMSWEKNIRFRCIKTAMQIFESRSEEMEGEWGKKKRSYVTKKHIVCARHEIFLA